MPNPAYTNKGYQAGTEEEKMNSHYQKTLNAYKGTVDSKGKDLEDIPHNKPTNGQNPSCCPMHTNLMNFTQMLEAMDDISASMDAQSPENDLSVATVSDAPAAPTDTGAVFDNKEVLDELNKIFTPVLVMQGIESDVSDKTNAELSEAGTLNEKTMISFDEPARMAQLQAVCALLIAKKKNTPEWQMYKKAASVKTKAKLDIQKKEMSEAKALAQKYLVTVSTTNNSSVARDAANKLLPHTNH